jgi:hypothetical protein
MIKDKLITTKDCKSFIIGHFIMRKVAPTSPLIDQNSWKRVSKRGTAIIYREFRNSVLGTRVQVESTPYEIYKLTEL